MLTPASQVIRLLGITALSAAAVQDASVIPAAARRTIAETNAAWLEAMRHQDAVAIAAIYGDEALFITATGEALRGRSAIEHFERERFSATGRVVEGTVEDDGLEQAGQCVYEWGHVLLRVARSDGTLSTVTGHFLTVWAADSTGHWRITRNLSLP